jgi:hypothetical protein
MSVSDLRDYIDFKFKNGKIRCVITDLLSGKGIDVCLRMFHLIRGWT